MIDSQFFDKVGKIEIGQKFDMSVFGPALLKMAVTCASFQTFGKCPISNKLLNSLESENEIGVEIR